MSINISNLLLLILLSSACANVSHQKSEAQPSNFAVPNPTPVAKPQIQENFIVGEGWHIPSPTRLERLRSSIIDGKDRSGNTVKVEITDFGSKDDYFFYPKPDTVDVGDSFLDGRFKLMYYRELTVKDKPYAYSIFVRKVLSEERGKVMLAEHMSYYISLDSDGDGKFETVLSPANELTVPDWALKNQ